MRPLSCRFKTQCLIKKTKQHNEVHKSYFINDNMQNDIMMSSSRVIFVTNMQIMTGVSIRKTFASVILRRLLGCQAGDLKQ